MLGFVKRKLLELDMGILYWIMCVFRTALYMVDTILDLAVGVTIQYGGAGERLLAKEYEHSAQVVKVLGRGNYSLVNVHQLHNFIWCHKRYVHPKCVLERDNITLMGATPKHVFFCVSDPDIDIYDTKVKPEMFFLIF